MNRKTLKSDFTKDNVPDWVCPTCSKGVLRLKDKSLVFDHSKKSTEAYRKNDIHEVIEYVYSCIFECNNKSCKENLSSTGSGFVEIDEIFNEKTKNFDFDHVNFFVPKYFEPPLNIFKIPEKCPKVVVESLIESFKLFFASPKAAANQARIALEVLLTEFKIKSYTINSKRSRIKLNLHQRIDLMGKSNKKYAQFKDFLLACKWLGNEGSHIGVITQDDVLDLYDLVEHVLREVYESPTEKLKSLAKKINKNKGSGNRRANKITL